MLELDGFAGLPTNLRPEAFPFDRTNGLTMDMQPVSKHGYVSTRNRIEVGFLKLRTQQ